MATKIWTNAETLTVADINAYATNNGLKMINETSVSTSTVISNVFTSVYENYRIVGSNFNGAANLPLAVRLAVSGTPAVVNYNYGGMNVTTAGARTLFGAAATTNFLIGYVGATASASTSFVLDIFRPQKTTATGFTCSSSSDIGTVLYMYQTSGNNTNATAYDGIQFLHNLGGSAMTGTIRIYGYREA